MRARPAALDDLTARPYAHRGLFGTNLPENSLAAARAAIAGGFGIECDVRLSRDGIAYVFHDSRLARLTGANGRFAMLDESEIAALRLTGSAERIPTLASLLALTGAHTPLLIEIKSDQHTAVTTRLCAAVAGDLAHHSGPAAVMSFDPLVCHWFARHRPQVTRGLVISRRHQRGMIARRGAALAIARANPHFIACDVRDLPQASAMPRRLGRALLCWTVRTPHDRARAAASGAQIIFEDRG